MQPVTIPAPPSKSYSHRVLMAAALAKGVSRVSHVLESDDTARTMDVFHSLGASFTRTGKGAYSVTGTGGQVNGGVLNELDIFVGESGTTCRLATAILAAGKGLFRVHGAGRMHERPLGELADALSSLGAEITYEGREGCPPFVLSSSGLRALEYEADEAMVTLGCDESSQYLSGLLLAAALEPWRNGPNSILLGGTKAVSWPYVSLTLETLERFGVGVRVEALGEGGWEVTNWRALKEGTPGRLRFLVTPGPYACGEYTVEGDWSGASYFLAAGAIGPQSVRVTGLQPQSLQGDAALLEILRSMGARIDLEEDAVTVHPAALRGIAVDMGHCPDLVPTVAALAAHASGRTVISGAAHLAIKESNRIAAPAAELRKCGCAVEETTGGMVITPPKDGIHLPAEPLLVYGDHRMAMSLSLLGLPGRSGGAARNVAVDEPSCVAKSFPDFWKLWERLVPPL